MKKSIKKIVAMGMMAVLISSNAMAVSAQTKSGKVNGINFNTFSNLSRTTASSGTVSSSPKLKTKVTSTYVYVDLRDNDLITVKRSQSGTAAATLSFSAPKNCKGVSISSNHMASSGGDTWSGSTYES